MGSSWARSARSTCGCHCRAAETRRRDSTCFPPASSITWPPTPRRPRSTTRSRSSRSTRSGARRRSCARSSSPATPCSLTSCSCTRRARIRRCASRATRSRTGSSAARRSRASTPRLPSSEAERLVLEPGDSPDHPLAAWFDDMRRQRRRHYASRPAPNRGTRSRALITMVHNEPVFLPLWLGYYSRFFKPQDIYVFDNESDDGSTDREGFVRIPVRHSHVDHTWMVRTIQDLQHELLDRYDMVLVTDVDEIV